MFAISRNQVHEHDTLINKSDFYCSIIDVAMVRQPRKNIKLIQIITILILKLSIKFFPIRQD